MAMPAAASSRATTYNPELLGVPLTRSNREKGLDQDPKRVEVFWEEV
ncbi:MAG: hypothetical protein JAZ02_07480 [Candidatus Thiodiazotropha endolucinida]|nr:hypothetical protein [Candidatus Thiodiazotropha endolucinida]